MNDEIEIKHEDICVTPSNLAILAAFRLAANLAAIVACCRWCHTWPTWIGGAALFTFGLPYFEIMAIHPLAVRLGVLRVVEAKKGGDA